MKAYPATELHEEMAFIAYYFHWPHSEIVQLPHGQRRRWCAEISRINRDLNGERKNVFDV
jgi:hypothetical protein